MRLSPAHRARRFRDEDPPHRARAAVNALRASLALAVFAVGSACLKPEPLPGEPNATITVQTGAAGAAEASDAPDPVLVDIAGYALTLGEFERRATRLSDIAQLRLNTTHGRAGLLEMFVWLELLAREARLQGLVGTADELMLVDEARARALLESDAAGSVDRDALSESLPEYFAERREEFTRPERRRVYGIVLPDRAAAERARADVERALEHARPAHVFGRLAPYYSVEADSAAAGGRYGWVVRNEDGGTGDPLLVDAVFEMAETGLGPVVRTTRGWEVIYVAAIQPAMALTFQEVEAYLGEQQYRGAVADHQRARLDAVREEVGVEVDGSAVAALAARRTSEPDGPQRERRYARDALAGVPSAELGFEVVAATEADQARMFDNPFTRPVDPPRTEPEGSADEASAAP